MKSAAHRPDPFTIEIIKNALAAIADEMFAAQRRASMSPVIYETLDFGIGLTDVQGRLIAQGTGIPGFVGVLDGAVRDVLGKFGAGDISEGDIFITNDPYGGGGTHLSDVSLLKPVFFQGRLVAWAASKAHWTELGGAHPGSFSTRTTDVFQEGLQFPVVRLARDGEVQPALLDMLRANVRLPEQTLGDLWSGIAALKIGERRLAALLARYGSETTLAAIEALLEHGAAMVDEAFKELPRGRFSARDQIDGDGLGNGPFEVAVEVRITDEEFVADFTGSASAAPGPINCTRPALLASAREVFMNVATPQAPATDGCFRRLKVICPGNTVFSATRPSPTSSYFEAMVAAADVMRSALAPAVPGRLMAGQFGSVCSMVLAMRRSAEEPQEVLVQPLVGGWGGGRDKDGENAQFCVGNGETANIPVEIQEARYPVRVLRYALRNPGGDAGLGAFRGGAGVLLEYALEEGEAELSTFFSRSSTRPGGIAGGCDGSPNYAVVVSAGRESERLGMSHRLPLKAGDRIRLVTGAGAGWGPPAQRPRQAVIADLEDGYVSLKQAEKYFGKGAL